MGLLTGERVATPKVLWTWHRAAQRQRATATHLCASLLLVKSPLLSMLVLSTPGACFKTCSPNKFPPAGEPSALRAFA